MLSYVLTAILSISSVWIIHKLFEIAASRKCKRPPALPSLPLVGSLPFLGKPEKLHELFTEKSKKDGNVFAFNAGTRYTVVVNGLESIRECLTTRSTEVAGRAEVYVERNAYNSLGRGIIFRQYDDRLKKNRIHSLSILKQFGLGSRSRIESILHEELNHVTNEILKRSGEAYNPAHLLELSTMNIIHQLMFGERLDYSDPTAEYIRETVKVMADSIDALYDFLPLCAYLPTWRKRIESLIPVGKQMKDFLAKKICKLRYADISEENEPHEDRKQVVEPNFVSEYLSRSDNQYKESEEELNYILRDLLAGGTDTTSGQLGWALILLANNPEVQSKAHEVIDECVESSRFPSLDDKDNLKYIEAIIMEVLRLKTAVPLGGPRAALTSTHIGGYDVPAGTMIILNLWSAHMDQSVWLDPEKFRPERFLNENGEIINKEALITFSLGKRSCPGELLARHEMFLFLTTILQRFTILPPDGEAKVKDEPFVVRVNTPAPHTLRMVDRLQSTS